MSSSTLLLVVVAATELTKLTQSPFYEGLLLCPGPAFELTFSTDGFGFGLKCFGVDKSIWTVDGGVSRACSVAVPANTPLNVAGVTDVVRSVTALKNVGMVRHRVTRPSTHSLCSFAQDIQRVRPGLP